MRIFAGGFPTETNTFSPVPITLTDFLLTGLLAQQTESSKIGPRPNHSEREL
jgi:microcystin degradation protein MlrC